MKRISKRIGKFEIRSTGNSIHDFEVLEWFPNGFYGKKDQYVKVSPGHYRNPMYDFGSIHESCFESPENCVVIGFIDEDLTSNVGWSFKNNTITISDQINLELAELLSFFGKWEEWFYKAIE